MAPYRRINWSLSYFLIGIYNIPTWLEDWKKLECIVNLWFQCQSTVNLYSSSCCCFFLAMHATAASIQKNATQFWNVQTVNYIISVIQFIYIYLEMKYFHVFVLVSFRCTFSLHSLLEINCQLVLDIPDSTLHTSRTDMVHSLLQNEF
jgi:hypothetical protein